MFLQAYLSTGCIPLYFWIAWKRNSITVPASGKSDGISVLKARGSIMCEMNGNVPFTAINSIRQHCIFRSTLCTGQFVSHLIKDLWWNAVWPEPQKDTCHLMDDKGRGGGRSPGLRNHSITLGRQGLLWIGISQSVFSVTLSQCRVTLQEHNSYIVQLWNFYHVYKNATCTHVWFSSASLYRSPWTQACLSLPRGFVGGLSVIRKICLSSTFQCRLWTPNWYPEASQIVFARPDFDWDYWEKEQRSLYC